MTLLIVVLAIVGYLCAAVPLAVIVGRMIAGPRRAEPNPTEQVVGGSAGKRGNGGNGATIVVTCRVCARRVRIEHVDGRQLVDRAGFLSAHQACLSHNRSSSRPHRSA